MTTEALQEQLLPCPFCGNTNTTITKTIHGDFNLVHRCSVMGFMKDSRFDEETLVAKWNTRAALSSMSNTRHEQACNVLREGLDRVRKTGFVSNKDVPHKLALEYLAQADAILADIEQVQNTLSIKPIMGDG